MVFPTWKEGADKEGFSSEMGAEISKVEKELKNKRYATKKENSNEDKTKRFGSLAGRTQGREGHDFH
jgi:hypothetical protein